VPMPVVGVEAPESPARCPRDRADLVAAADVDAGAAHAEVHVDEDAEVRGERRHLVHGLGQGRERGPRPAGGELGEPVDAAAVQVVGEEDVT